MYGKVVSGWQECENLLTRFYKKHIGISYVSSEANVSASRETLEYFDSGKIDKFAADI